ncbi:hypothetical protein DYBT9275_05656 [Dyadobacter sp. CECT 9275]|uniref:FecR protein domain-containing protein n=1 Tax=Dyadobacter helix TaxID=2822344 RepID=A0A916JK97_9BACT|nr:FecR domain-containing protein [Dyadobacter sp. CECT 9275]CAG5016878.1 hypothetical protein DYBT9275_05656 [Dyadobacter sp. CECT 9275]
MEYSDYKAADFCADPHFVQWVLSPTTDTDMFWKEFRAVHPEKEEEIRSAILMLNSIEFEVTQPSGKRLAALKSRIEYELDKADRGYDKKRSYLRYSFAACFAMILIAVGFRIYTSSRGVRYETGYGELREIKMKEGSEIVLNARSSVVVYENLSGNREVELNGEAFFKIAKIKGSRFIVKTPEARVEVLGTQFNVHTRRENTTVVLREGKVNLSNGKTLPVYMKPGEMASVSKQNAAIALQKVKPSDYLSWMKRVLILDNTPVSQALLTVEDSFGVKIELAKPELLRKNLSGQLPLENINDFANDLAIILDLQVMKTAKGYRLY